MKSEEPGEAQDQAESEPDQSPQAATDREPDQYPLDPGAAYTSEPEPEDQSFSEPEHWLQPARRQRGE